VKPVVWIDKALDDLIAIGKYISQDNPSAAYKTLVKIKASADTLEYSPNLGRLGRVKGTRELSITNLPYVLAYQVRKEDIQILAIMHTSRKWPQSL
jgi:addiction module RelE/StbE family toxin